MTLLLSVFGLGFVMGVACMISAQSVYRAWNERNFR